MRSERLPFEGLSNCRDLGGFIGINGKKTISKKVYRSNSLDELTDKDILTFEKDIKLAYVVDLRSVPESKMHPDKAIDGVNYLILPFHGPNSLGEPYPHKDYQLSDKSLMNNIRFLFCLDERGWALDAMRKNYRDKMNDLTAKSSIKAFFELLANMDEGAVLFHCHEGKDRTGILAMLYLGLLGVSDKDIIEDYLATNEYLAYRKENRKRYFDEVAHLPSDDPMYQSLIDLAGVNESWIKAAMDEVYRFGGYESYLNEQVGLSKDAIATIRAKYLI